VPVALAQVDPPNDGTIRPPNTVRNESCKMCAGYSVHRGGARNPARPPPRPADFAACIAGRLTPCRWQSRTWQT